MPCCILSLVALVPAVIPLLLLLIPAMLASLSVAREKEFCSIVNLYVTPTTRLEFLLGKQLPYIALAMVNFLLLTLLAVTAFGVPLTISASGTSAPGPTRPRPTARPSASSRPPCANGPMPRLTRPQITEPQSCPSGSTDTIGTDPMLA
jgi:hypothetical protein